ncbi:hypothetical protein ACWGJT_26545 [Streptomyces xantholiticus]
MPPSGSISRTPTSRARDTWATCSSSYQRRIRFTGSTIIWAISAPVVSWPMPIQHRLVGANPAASQLSISLSSSANYIGVSLAPVVGGFLLDDVVSLNHLGFPAAGIIVLGLVIGELSHLLIRRSQAEPADGKEGASASTPSLAERR